PSGSLPSPLAPQTHPPGTDRAARRALRRRPLPLWQPLASCGRRATQTRLGTACQDPTDRVGAEPAMLDIAPAIDFAKHRPEAAVGGVQPRLQRTHRAVGERCGALNRRGAVDTR